MNKTPKSRRKAVEIASLFAIGEGVLGVASNGSLYPPKDGRAIAHLGFHLAANVLSLLNKTVDRETLLLNKIGAAPFLASLPGY